VRKKAKDEARKARNDVYRQHILEAAEEVFAEKGFDAAKLQDIGTRAGLSMGTIYAIFPGKTELFTAILEERGQEVADLVAQERDVDLTVVARVLVVPLGAMHLREDPELHDASLRPDGRIRSFELPFDLLNCQPEFVMLQFGRA